MSGAARTSEGEAMPAWLRLAHYDPAPAEVLLTYRSGWTRFLRAAVVLVLTPVVSVVAFLIPPHGEPLFLAVGVGLYLLYREASTSYVVRRFRGSCPRCGNEMTLKPGSRLTGARSIPCYNCHFHPYLMLGPPPRPEGEGDE